jgi:serine/threonine protein kinase/predicted Zn-dependent protease
MTSTGDRDPLDLLAEEFVARLRAGEPVTVAEYADRHPELAEAICSLFPTLLEIERLKPRPGEVTEDHHQTEPSEAHLPATIGEFRIVREVGRGGMGVVYEAVQESLGRHVALKVLPAEALSDPKRRERFRREAKAAAQLHHTNIVPVFGTGEAGGLHFYAMQFIPGQPLDQVLAELRKLQTDGPATTSAVTAAFPLTQGTTPGNTPSRPPQSGLSTVPGRPYWESVARLGFQAASALAHAHAHGVLHRDVKPSNLLLDPQGTLWIADFGLAKLADEDDLTAAGDILGTLRYMAPERFAGQCDARADIYALGLTLYELATLRPAFDESGREKLIAQVTQGEPLRPSQLNRAIPRDLETIILKAIAREPAARYQSAAELAEDLQRFAEDRPILARRESVSERLGRWARRNPVLACLTALTAILLVAATGSATLAALSYARMLRASEADKLSTHRANELGEEGYQLTVRKDWPKALAAYTEATRVRPQHSQVWSDRGTMFLRLGLADEAAADYAQLFKVREPQQPAFWCYHAALRLHKDDADGYRDVCRAMREHFQDTASPEVIRALALVCTLGPGGCDDPEALVRLVVGAAERHPTEDFAGVQVAALYRAGKYREVVAATNPAGPNDRSQPAAVLCLRALSLAALGETAPARGNLTAAREKLDATASILSLQPFGPAQADRFVGPFPPPQKPEGLADWLVDTLLWREATARADLGGAEHPLPLFMRARGCAALGWWDAADAVTARTVELCMGDEKARQVPEVALVERARLNAARDRWAEVAADLERAGQLARPTYRLSVQAARLYSAFGRPDDARRHLAEAVTRAPADLDLRVELGRASTQLGDWDGAATDLVAVLNDPRWIPRPTTSRSIGGGGFEAFFPALPAPLLGASGADLRKEVREYVARHDELYARVTARGTRDQTLRRERGRYLLSARRWDDAVAFYVDWIDHPLEPFTLPPPGLQVGLSEIAADVAPHDEVFGPLVRRFPTRVALWVARCEWYLRARDVDKAADTLAQALATPGLGAPAPAGPLPFPAFADPVVGRDAILRLAGRTEELFNAVVARRPKDGELWLTRFYEQINRKDGAGAEAAAREVLRRGVAARDTLGQMAANFNLTFPDRSASFVREAVRLQPEDAFLQMHLFHLCTRNKEWDEAAQAFGAAVRITSALPPEPGRPSAVFSLCYNSLPANLDLGELARRRPDDGILWHRYGTQLTAGKKLTEAADALDRAANLLKTNRATWTDLTRAHLLLKNWDAAAAALDRALALTGPPGQPGVGPLVVYQDLPLSPEVIEELSQRRPQDVDLWLVHARWLVSVRRWDEATALFEKVAMRSKQPALVWTELARVHCEQKNWKEAARFFDKVLAAGPPVPFPPPLVPGFLQPTTPTPYTEIVTRSFSSPEASALFTTVAKLRPDDGRLWMEYCRYLTSPGSGRPRLLLDTELRQALDELVKRAPKEPVAWVERANFRATASEFDRAADDYVAAAELLPPQGPTNQATWPIYFAVYNRVVAQPELFDRFTTRRKEDPFPWYYRAFRHADAPNVFADLERAINLRPKDTNFLAARRRFSLEFGQWDRAAEDAVAELKVREPAAGAVEWVEVAAALAAAGKNDEYRALCRRMREVWQTPRNPTEGQQLAWAAALLPDSGVPAETLLELAESAHKAELAESAHRAQPAVIGNVFTLALARCRLGQHEQAATLVRETLKRSPNISPVVHQVLLEFVAAVALARDGKVEEALEFYRDGCQRMAPVLQVGNQRRRVMPGQEWAAVAALRREAAKLLEEEP